MSFRNIIRGIKSSVVNINGMEYRGKNVHITGSHVVIDGQKVDGLDVEKLPEINIVIQGDVEKVDSVSGDVTAQCIGSLKTSSGDVTVEQISGDIHTVSGDIQTTVIYGDVVSNTGDVSAHEIQGAVTTKMGDITTSR